MKNLFPILLGILLFGFGCSSEEPQQPDPNPSGEEEPTNENPQEQEPEMVTYFTFDPFLPTSETDDWIIIHDSDGNLLDYKPYEYDDVLEFQILEGNDMPNDLTITLFRYEGILEGHIQHFIKSYPEIPAGSIWKQTSDPQNINGHTRADATGSFNITTTNLVSPKYQTISDKNGPIMARSGPDLEGFITDETFNNVPIYTENEFFYSIYDSEDELKYHVIEEAYDGEDIVVDYSEFKPYDSILEVEIPDHPSYFVLCIISAFESDQPINFTGGKSLSFIISEIDAPNPLKIGFLDTYNKYHCIFNFNNEEYAYNYIKYGDKPNAITIPNTPTITVEDSSISNYRFETNLDYRMKDVFWEVSEGENFVDLIKTTWNVYSSPEFVGTIGEIPDEIQETYPDLRINDLMLKSTMLHLDFISYPELIQEEFVNPDLKTYYKSRETLQFKH